MDFAAAATHCHMHDLPDEVFARILNLLPIKQVIRCSIVSKRWDAACRYIIRTRESLSIGNDKTWGWLCGRRELCHMNDITLKNNQLIPAMMISLNKMVELRRLFANTSEANRADIIPFIRKFADQLSVLEIGFAVSMIGAESFSRLTRLQCGPFDANPSAAFPELTELIVFGLKNHTKLPNMRLPSLKKLLIVRSYREGDEELVSEFILANADTLTILQMSGIPLRLDPAVVFPNLMKVDCRCMVNAGRYPFPALTHLTIESVTAEFLTRLHADQMLSLEVAFCRNVGDVVPAISKMRNLTSLKLIDNGWGEARDPFSSVFNRMHHLEKVELIAYNCSNEQNNRMIATLAHQNPKLSHVFFYGIHVTDAALTSLAQLQHLTVVSSRVSQGEKVTTSGVLTLLRGSSRNMIRQFTIDNENVDGNQVIREISLMCEERGTKFDKNHAGFYIDCKIHA